MDKTAINDYNNETTTNLSDVKLNQRLRAMFNALAQHNANSPPNLNSPPQQAIPIGASIASPSSAFAYLRRTPETHSPLNGASTAPTSAYEMPSSCGSVESSTSAFSQPPTPLMRRNSMSTGIATSSTTKIPFGSNSAMLAAALTNPANLSLLSLYTPQQPPQLNNLTAIEQLSKLINPTTTGLDQYLMLQKFQSQLQQQQKTTEQQHTLLSPASSSANNDSSAESNALQQAPIRKIRRRRPKSPRLVNGIDNKYKKDSRLLKNSPTIGPSTSNQKENFNQTSNNKEVCYF